MIRHIYYFFLLCSALACGAVFFSFNHSVLDHTAVDKTSIAHATILLDKNGIEWARLTREQSDPVAYHRLPQHLINAIVATEDRSFFSHSGISVRDIIRSIVVNLKAGRVKQGASTITQQLVKLSYFDQRRLFSRKIAEQVYAILLERELSKEEIFERYVNSVYFGCGIYGIAAACRAFWNISVESLSLAQSALIAGIICSPGRLCPLINPEGARQRQRVTLRAMQHAGYISEEERLNAESESLECIAAQPCIAPHYREIIRSELEKKLGKHALYTRGFTVQTTLDSTLQKTAHHAFSETVRALRNTVDPELDGALISLENHTGAVRAYIGGYDYTHSQFNRVRASRQIGSLIKPFIYAAALETGHSLSDIVIDEPLTIGEGEKAWSPRNFNNKFVGPLTRAEALAKSNNICTIKTYQEVGHAACLPALEATRLAPPKQGFPAFALGCIDRTLETITAALASIPQDGLYIQPYLIEWIRDWSGKKIFVHETPQPVRALSSTIAAQIHQVLEKVPERRCRAYRFAPITGHAWGKTGTTNDARSIWYCGGAHNLTIGIYLGRDDHKALAKIVLASQSAFPLWHMVMNTLQQPIAQ